MTLLHRWRFHPAFPCPPCIPESRCWPDLPQPWHRLARRRLVFRRLVAMDGPCFSLLSCISGSPGLSRGWVGLELNIFRFDELSGWGKPINALSFAGVLAGAGLAVCGSPPSMAARVAKPGQRDPVMAEGVLDAQA